MLTENPANRPTADELLTRVTGYDLADSKRTRRSIFGECCANVFVSKQQLQSGKPSLEDEVQKLKFELEEVKKSRDEERSRFGQVAEPSDVSNVPTAIERWDTLSAHWEGLASYWMRRLEQNSDHISQELSAQQMSRQITDLSAAGANLFHAVTELQRLRASSERKFQRWFYEHRQEQEEANEREATLRELLREEREARAQGEPNAGQMRPPPQASELWESDQSSEEEV